MNNIGPKQFVVVFMGQLYAETDQPDTSDLFSNKHDNQKDFDDLNEAKQYALKSSEQANRGCAVIDRNGYPQQTNGKGKIIYIAYKDFVLDKKDRH